MPAAQSDDARIGAQQQATPQLRLRRYVGCGDLVRWAHAHPAMDRPVKGTGPSRGRHVVALGRQLPRALLADDHAIAHPDDPVADGAHLGVIGDDHEGLARS